MLKDPIWQFIGVVIAILALFFAIFVWVNPDSHAWHIPFLANPPVATQTPVTAQTDANTQASVAAQASATATESSICYENTSALNLSLALDNATGPQFASSRCRNINIKLTSATYRTYARACLETMDGSQTVQCGNWVLLTFRWDTLMTDVPDGTHFRFEYRADAKEQIQGFVAY